MNRDVVRQVVNVLSVIATIAVNGLANALPLNGMNTGEISDRFQVYFVPAGYVFSIWGLIYLGLIAFAVYQALPSQRENPRLRRVGYLFTLSGVLNIGWLFAWHYEQFALSVVLMLALLATLIAIFGRLRIGRVQPAARELWAVDIPVSIYLGWITVATIANITSFLDFINWNGFGIAPETWTLLMFGAAVLVAAAMTLSRRNLPYLLVLVWALSGIAIKHSGVETVATGAWVATGLVGLMALLLPWLNRNRPIALQPSAL